MENITLRIKFTKFGPIKFIGHLDVMRYFQKAIRRAGLDIKYTNGFNPHQIMSFAAPLSVGVESMGEYMDIEMNSIISTDDVKLRLNQCMAEGIEIVDAICAQTPVTDGNGSVAKENQPIITDIRVVK